MSDWYCAGCGIASPEKRRSCNCPTNVVCRDGDGGHVTAWKERQLAQQCHDLIARLYEKPSRKLKAPEIDLVKTALQEYAMNHRSE